MIFIIHHKYTINRNLEAFAKQLYDYWFVQFDFPNENGKPYKASGGEMVWNEQLKRKIPKDWKVSNICSLLTMYMERCDYVPDGLVYTPIEVLPRKSMSFYEVAPLEEAVSGLCRYYKGDVLLSNRRIYFHKVCIAPFDGVTRDTVITLRSNDDKYYCYAFQTINSDHFISWATKHSYGSEQPVFSWNEARNYLVAIPPTQIAEKFESIVRFSIDKVCISQLETQNLIKQRDELLPLLMNGQVAINSDLSFSFRILLQTAQYKLTFYVIFEHNYKIYRDMTKAEIVAKISDKTGITKPAIQMVIDSMMEVVKENVSSGEDVCLRGFGTFGLKHKALRHFNYAPGKMKIIPEHDEPGFKPSKEFKDKVR